MIEKIISGGQTGVDEAALEAAMKHRIVVGGWCPKGRINENGSIPKNYNFLKEVSGTFKDDKENRDARTKLNIRDSDGTLVLLNGTIAPDEKKDGTSLTIKEAKNTKPQLTINLSDDTDTNINKIVDWLRENNIKILNIGGPSEFNSPGIHLLSLRFLEKIFSALELKNEIKNSSLPRAKL